MFESVLVADRGVLARRVLRSVARRGLRAVAVYTENDAALPFVQEADEAVLIATGSTAEGYGDAAAVLEAAQRSEAEAVHPAGGPLAEDPDFAASVQAAGLVWIGPGPAVMAARAQRRASAGFLPSSRRWLEVPFLGLADGRVLTLGERECRVTDGGVVVAEAPARLAPALRGRLQAAAMDVGSTCRGLGTLAVEVGLASMAEPASDIRWRLLPEDAATELALGVDLVDLQLSIAVGEDPALPPPAEPGVHALSVRVLVSRHPVPGVKAGVPAPSSPATPRAGVAGADVFTRWDQPVSDGVRIDAGYAAESAAPNPDDPLLAVLAVRGVDRADALARARVAAAAMTVEGVGTTLPLVAGILEQLAAD